MKVLSQVEYTNIKKGLKHGKTRKDVANDVKRSIWTVGAVSKSKNYANYRQIIAEKHALRTRKAESKKESFIKKLINFFK